MVHPGSIPLLFQSVLVARLAKIGGGGLLSCVILGWIVGQVGPPHGEAVVHITEPNVEVTIGGNVYHIESRRYDPIVCRLPIGRHSLIMSRDGNVLHKESF
jgi:hypothetical protein